MGEASLIDKVTLLSRRQQSLTRRCQANTIERSAFDDQPTLSNRPIHCSLRRSFVDLQTAGDLMQHDWLQGPAIDGRAPNLNDDSAGKKFIVLHGRQRALGSSVPDVETALDLPSYGVGGAGVTPAHSHGSLARQRLTIAWSPRH